MVGAALAALVLVAVCAALVLWLLLRTAATEGMRGPGKTLLSINGEDNTEPHPYYVQLVNARYGLPFCGGILIRETVVLAAAHCVYNSGFDDIYCTIGDDNSDEPIEYRYVKKVVLHPEYDHANAINTSDIALLILDSPVLSKKPCALIKNNIMNYSAKDEVIALGRGMTNRDIPLYLPNTKVPRNLQAFKPVAGPGAAASNKKDRIQFQTTGSGLIFGDSGGPLLVKLNGEWFVIGVFSSFVLVIDGVEVQQNPIMPTTNFDSEVSSATTFMSVSFYFGWITTTADAETKAGAAKDLPFVTVHEVAHVVALARLKHLKKIAASKGSEFEDLFLPGEGEARKRWLDLAEYIRDDPGRYGALPSAKEAQLAVAWALVSSRDNYAVLLEMLSDSSGSVPYFLRLGYTYEPTSGSLSSLDDRQKFATGSVGGSGAWKDGKPTLWKAGGGGLSSILPGPEKEWTTASKDEYFAASPTELKFEKVQMGLRKPGAKKRFLESRPLRRRMFCEFADTLNEYLAARRPWYPKYLQFNNIDSPGRAAGLLECISQDPQLYLDENGTPKTSYGANSAECGYSSAALEKVHFPTSSSSSIPFHATANEKLEQLNSVALSSGTWESDPSRAWLQASGDHWPELTATTLYDRYEWIEMPDSKRKITFREAAFLIADDARIDVPGGVEGVGSILPTVDVGPKFNLYVKHPGANNILRYYPSFLLYMYQKTAALVKAPDAMRAFIKGERLRPAFVTRGSPDHTYLPGDEVYAVNKSGLFRQNKVRGSIVVAEVSKPKNAREIVLRTPGKEIKLNLDRIYDAVNASYYATEKGYFFIFPAQKSWTSYLITRSDGQYSKDFDAMDIEPIGKKVQSRYLRAFWRDGTAAVECTPTKTKKTQPRAPPPPPGSSESQKDLLENEKKLQAARALLVKCL